MTHPVEVIDILRQAAILVGKAEALGVQVRITSGRNPLDTGSTRHSIDAWASSRATPLPPKVIMASTRTGSGIETWPVASDKFLDALEANSRRRISDREWAAQPANLREGCTVRVPGVGEL